jgi:hypothetical protein
LYLLFFKDVCYTFTIAYLMSKEPETVGSNKTIRGCPQKFVYPRPEASPKLIVLSFAPPGCEVAAAPSTMDFRHNIIPTSYSHS